MTKAERIAAIKTRFDETVTHLRARFGDAFKTSDFRDNFRVHVEPGRVYAMLEFLKGDGFDQLIELGGADYMHYPDAQHRYGVWYCLTKTTTGERIIVKTFADDPSPKLPSVYDLWRGSDWMEREVYDMYGVEFTNHPDLRRILMPDEFAAFPLRKDYPMRGRGERHNFRSLTRAES